MADYAHSAPEALHGVEKLSRRDVARALGVTKSAVRYLERTGQLRAVPDANGEATFVRAEVIVYAAKRLRRASRNAHDGGLGLVAADIFARFAAAESAGRLEHCLPDIVRATGAPPALVRALFAEYRTPLGLRVAPPPPASGVDAAAAARDELAAAREAKELEARILARHEASDAEHARAMRAAELEDEREDNERRARRAARRKE